MAEIVCPECGLVTTLAAIRRSADEFCAHCDYPLFWAPTALPLVTGSAGSDATLRRLPGAGGRMLIGTLVCPECGELNPMSEVDCIRCGSPLHPVEVEPEPEPEPPPPPPPPPEPEPRSWWWLWILITAIVGVIGAVLLILAL